MGKSQWDNMPFYEWTASITKSTWLDAMTILLYLFLFYYYLLSSPHDVRYDL